MPRDAVVIVPQKLQLIIVSPQAAVAVFNQDVRSGGIAGEVADTHRVDIDPVEGVLSIGNAAVKGFQRRIGDRNWDAGQLTARGSFQNPQAEIHDRHHFVLAVPVDVGDLEGKIRRQIGMFRVGTGFADLPEDFAGKIKGGHAADVGVAVAQYPLMMLADDHIQSTVPGQIPETQVPSRAEVLQADATVQLHLGVKGALCGQIRRHIGLDRRILLLIRSVHGNLDVRILYGHRSHQGQTPRGIPVAGGF